MKGKLVILKNYFLGKNHMGYSHFCQNQWIQSEKGKYIYMCVCV